MDMQINQSKFKELIRQCQVKGICKLFPLSYSLMISGISCPAQLNYRRLSGKPGGIAIDSAAAKVGTFNHRVAQLCIQNSFLVDRDVDSMEYDFFWPNNARGLTRAELLQAQMSRDDLWDTLVKVLNTLTKFKLEAFVEPTWGVNLKGKAFAPKQKNAEKFITGKIDVVGLNKDRTKGLVLDYKTHAKKEQNFDELRNQLITYIISSKLKYPQLVTLTAGVAYITGAVLDVVIQLTTPQQFQEIFDEFFSFVEKFINCWEAVEACIPKKNPKCKWCSYSPICSIQVKK